MCISVDTYKYIYRSKPLKSHQSEKVSVRVLGWNHGFGRLDENVDRFYKCRNPSFYVFVE